MKIGEPFLVYPHYFSFFELLEDDLVEPTYHSPWHKIPRKLDEEISSLIQKGHHLIGCSSVVTMSTKPQTTGTFYLTHPI